MTEWKQIMIDTIRKHWFYGKGSLEAMTETEVQEIYDDLIDWLE